MSVPSMSVSLRAGLVLSLLLVRLSDGSLASYVKQICDRFPIHTTAPRTAGDNGFRIIIDGLPEPDVYRPGETYTVLINGSRPGQRLMGLMAEATASDKTGRTYTPGSFNTSVDGRVQDLKEDQTCDKHVLAHRYLVNKNGVKFLWTAPAPGAGCVHFNATVIEHSDVWYKDEGRLHLVICEELAPEHDWGSAPSNDLPGSGLGDCCACGHAMYTLEFKGLWSRNTHPKGFPDDKNSFQLNWSSLVGASHASDYQIWDYGQLASKAVRELCEFGSSKSLENEMKEQSDRIRTVIKTKQLWGPEAIQDSAKAVLTVHKMKPLLSLLTRIGPSPDWCLGITGQSLCTSNCTWLDHLEVDLFPWDAGTDSRVTYIGRKIPTDPPERIHRLTSTYPNSLDSPFYGVDIKPFARLSLTKNKETCTSQDGSSSSAENSPSTEELVSLMKKKMMVKKKLELEKCALSQWSDWSQCSNPCGNGVRERRRQLKNTDITADMCDQELAQSETCVGDCKDNRRKRLPEDFNSRLDDGKNPVDACAVTGWSEWSPCSATCGLGMKERWRMFLHHTERRLDCGLHLMEKDLCRAEVFDCIRVLMMKNFTAICQMSVDSGPCRGDFPRWFYNQNLEKCQVFSYGGCQGNQNRFETEEECVDLCAEHMADVFRKEQSQTRQDRSKQLTQQILGERERLLAEQRMADKQRTMDEDMRRKELLMQTQRIMQQKEILNEEDLKNLMMKQPTQDQSDMTQHSGPSRDTASTNQSAHKQKLMTQKQERLERRRMKRRKQKQEKLRNDFDEDEEEDEDSEDKMAGTGPETAVHCVVSSWTSWTPCSVTCGKGLMTKSRTVKVQPQHGGRKCPRRLFRKRRCRQKRCPVVCEMEPWSQWSACSQTCGDSSIQVRRRRRLQKWRPGGPACPNRRETRPCNLPKCGTSQAAEGMRNDPIAHRRF